MEQFSKQKTLDLQGGLFLIKYESAESQDRPPKVMIAVEPGSENRIDVILPPTVEEPILWSPGACLVARSAEGGRLTVTVSPSQPNGSTVARVQVTKLSNDPTGTHASQPAGAPAPETAPVELDLSTFRVMGHVAGLGDVLADAQSWIAGPAAPSRIECIAIEWPAKPTNLSLRYAVRLGGQRPMTTESVEAGKFAGTRGRALPLVGATLEISGPAARGYQLEVDAIFLGSPQMRVMGQRVVLSGPTGREPLVGLRAGIGPVSGNKSDHRKRDTEPDSPKSTQLGAKKPRERVRVFRGVAAGMARSAAAETEVASRGESARAGQSGRVRVFAGGAARKKRT